MGLALPPSMLGFHRRAHAAVTGRAPQSPGQQAPGAVARSAQPRLLTLSGSQPWPSKLCSATGRTPAEGARLALCSSPQQSSCQSSEDDRTGG